MPFPWGASHGKAISALAPAPFVRCPVAGELYSPSGPFGRKRKRPPCPVRETEPGGPIERMHEETHHLPDESCRHRVAVSLVANMALPANEERNLPTDVEVSGGKRLENRPFTHETLVAALSEFCHRLLADGFDPVPNLGIEGCQRQLLAVHAGPEVVIEVADGPFDLALGLGSSDTTPARGEPVVDGKSEQPFRRLPVPFAVGREGRAHVVVEDLRRYTAERGEGEHMAGKEHVLVHRRREVHEGLSRIAEHYDECIELRLLAVDNLLPEFLPVDLGLPAHLCLEADDGLELNALLSGGCIVPEDGDLAVIAHLPEPVDQDLPVVAGVAFKD